MKRTAGRAAMPTASPDAGVALLAVLWFLVAMSALAVTLLTLGRDSAHASRNAVRAIEVRTITASAVEITSAALWRGQLPPEGRLAWRQGSFAVAVAVSAESGKIDLNAASDELIEALVAVATEALGRPAENGLAVAHAILDWRDADRERRLAGAEAADYADADRRGRPRDGPFQHLAELRSVIGMDEALFAALAPAVSVYHGAALPAGERKAPLVQAALDRAQGLGLGMADGETSSDLEDQALNDEANSWLAPGFSLDPAGLYTIEVELSHFDGASFRQQVVIWVDPPFGTKRYAVLQSRSAMLTTPMATADEAAPTWPGR